MASYDYDLIVIGSGAGGAVAAQLAAQAGKRVALIEQGQLGGDCPNIEVPRLALAQVAHIYQKAKQAERFGVRSSTLSYNYPSLRSWQKLAAKRSGANADDASFINKGVSVIHGRAHLLDPHTVSVGAARFQAKQFLLATGAQLSLPSVAGLSSAGFVTPQDVLDLNRAPKQLAVTGSSLAALEYAQAFASFGSDVHLVINEPRLLHEESELASQTLTNVLTEEYGVKLYPSSALEAVTKSGLKKQLVIRRGKRKHAVLVDEILVAGPYHSATDIGLENAGVDYDESGILVNSQQQTSAKHIFAAGGCTNPLSSTAMATHQSRVAAHNLLHPKQLVASQQTPLLSISTNPEVARVGLSEASLAAAKQTYRVATTPLSIVPRANIADDSTGFISLLYHPKTKLILGATIVAPEASELIHELALAVQHRLTLEQLADTPHAFGSWSEVIKIAALSVLS